MTRERSISMMEENSKKLDILGHVARGNWREVVDMYRKNPEDRKVKIPRTGDTALHVAVSNRMDFLAVEMASVAGSDVLAIANEQGNTPLHLAATGGSSFVCMIIAHKHGPLIGARNDYGETPLFCAVTRGRAKAFLRLHHFCKTEPGWQQYGYYRRNNGDTILHSAISERHFDLAYIIIKEYPKLVHWVNEDGLSPLHLLATKLPETGVPVFWIHKPVYYCVRVRKLEQMRDLVLVQEPSGPSRRLYSFFNRHLGVRVPTLKERAYLERVPKRVSIWDIEDWCRGKCASCFTYLLQHTCRIIGLLVNRRESQQDEEAANRQVDRGKIDQHDETPNKQEYKVSRGDMALHAICGLLVFPLAIIWYIFYIGAGLLIQILLRVLFVLPKYVSDLKHVKQRRLWSVEVMNKLLEYPYQQGGMRPYPPREEDKDLAEFGICTGISTGEMLDTPILIAAKHGVVEMVSRILDVHPDAIFDSNAENKNIVMLAVEYRQPHLYQMLLRNWRIKQSIFGQVDKNGNSLLHIAANLGTGEQQQFWHIRGAALQMHMEVKWYQFIKHSMPPRFFARYNKASRTPKEIFQDSHRKLIEEGRQWLTNTSQSCSVVSALIATVAFATSATVPGGLKQENGAPTLEHKPVFIISAISSLIALCSSMISVVMFLGILTSSFKQKDFRKDLPNKLLLGLISLLVSIVSMLVSFFAGHHFVLKQELVRSATLIYTLICFHLIGFIVLKFPLDFKMVRTTFSNKPRK